MTTTRELTPEDLVTLRGVTDPEISDDGAMLAGVVHDPAPPRGEPARADIWLSVDGAAARPLTSGPGVDTRPRISPSGRRLAFTSDRITTGMPKPYVLDLDDHGAPAGEPRLLESVAGIVEDIIWSDDERRLVLRTADEGSDTGNIGGGLRFGGAGEEDADIVVRRPATFWRRIAVVDVEQDESVQVTPGGETVWEIGWPGYGPVAALMSADPTESGWYDAHVALVDLESGKTETVYTPEYQLQSPALSADGQRLAVIEGPQSDRALLSGEVTIVDLSSGEVERLPLDADVSRVRWTTDGRLFWTGRSSLESVCGFFSNDGSAWRSEEVWRGLVTLGATYLPMVACSADGQRLVAPRHAHGEPVELSVFESDDDGTRTWRPLTDVNAHAASWPVPEQRTYSWTAGDGLEIHGLLLLPPSTPDDAALPLVVVPHGGPTNASTSVFASGAHGGDALLLTQAGCAVLVPNVRGSVGRGREFMAANIGDMGGGDLADLEAGVTALVESGLVDPQRVGIVGISFGGFMAAWAAVRSTMFAASIPIAGISDWLSFHHTSNQGRMDEIFLAGSPYDITGRHLERSPVMHVTGCTTATLILHGDADLACPIGQAQELYQGLADAGATTEFVTYRGAGHGMSERHHRIDVQERILTWFTTHLGLQSPAGRGRVS
jgi:dipeptidyl aminopeptidase/acylaminoacyl peptidase